MQIKCMWSRERVKFDIGADVNWQEGGDRFKQAVWPTFWAFIYKNKQNGLHADAYHQEGNERL